MLTSISTPINILSNGGSKLLSRGTILISPIEKQIEEGGTDIGVFFHTIDGCYANTEIAFRGYATNIAGTVYSDYGYYKTLPNDPLAPILSITDNNSVKIDINGNDGNNDGGYEMNYLVYESVTDLYLNNHELSGFGGDYNNLTIFNSGYGLLTGLTGNTQYIFSVEGLGYDGDVTSNSPSTSIYTWANTPTAPVVNGATLSTLNIAIGSGDNNSIITKYLILDETTGYCVQPDGTLNSLPNWLTKSEWGTKTVIRLNSNTQYTFKVKAKNEDGIETAYGSGISKYTVGPDGYGTIVFNGLDISNGGSYVYAPNNTIKTWLPGTDDFTVEWFQYQIGTGHPRVFSIGPDTGAKYGVSIEGNSVYTWPGGNNYSIGKTYLNTWVHVALVRQTGSTKCYIDGTQVGTAQSNNINISGGTYNLYIGSDGISAGDGFNGNITNFRWTNSVVYSGSSFTPITSPLTKLTSTKLLLLGGSVDNPVVDATGINSLTFNNTTWSPSSPF